MRKIIIVINMFMLMLTVSCDDYLDDVINEAGFSDGLVAYWPVTEDTGLLVKDKTGNGNDIVLYDTTDTYFSTGLFNNSLLMGGTNRLGTVNNKTILDQNNAFTISMWIKITGDDPGNFCNIMTIFDKIFLTYNHSNLKLTSSIVDNSTTPYSIQATFVKDKWFHYTTVYDGAILSIFIDGKKMSEAEFNIVMYKPDMSLIFASRGYTESFSMEGSLDEIRIYNRALSGEEIKSLMVIGVN